MEEKHTNITVSRNDYILQCFHIVHHSYFKHLLTGSIHLKCLFFHSDKRDLQSHFVIFHIQRKLTFNVC